MANDCNTGVWFNGDEKDFLAMHKFVNDIVKDKIHVDMKELYDALGIECDVRGIFVWAGNDWTAHNVHITFTTSDVPPYKLMDTLAKKFNMKHYFSSEEACYHTYLTNDVEGKFWPERYVVVTKLWIEYVTSKEEGIAFIKEEGEEETGEIYELEVVDNYGNRLS